MNKYVIIEGNFVRGFTAYDGGNDADMAEAVRHHLGSEARLFELQPTPELPAAPVEEVTNEQSAESEQADGSTQHSDQSDQGGAEQSATLTDSNSAV